MQKIIKLITSVLLALSIISCGGGGSSGDDNKVIVANVNKGPVDGANCNLLDSVGNILVANQKSVNGRVEFKDVTYTGIMRIECSGGDYTDELDGKNKQLGTLQVAGVGSNFVLTPFTTIAYKRIAAANGFTNTAKVKAANEDTADELGLDGIDITVILPTDIGGGKTAKDDAAGKYAFAIAAFLQGVVNSTSTVGVDDLIDKVADDLKGDGAISTATMSIIADGVEDYANTVSTATFSRDIVGAIREDIAGKSGENGDKEADDSVPVIVIPVIQHNATITGVINQNLAWLPGNLGGDAVWSASPTASLTTLGLNFSTATGKISGTPTATTTGTVIAVKATNSAGSHTVNVNIVITNSTTPPNIMGYKDVSYRAGDYIKPIPFVNTGGKIASCEDVSTGTKTAELGLSLTPNIDGNSCLILGQINSDAKAGQTHTLSVKAINAGGSSTATVKLGITQALIAPDPNSVDGTYNKGDAINLEFVNSGGGELTNCQVANLTTTLAAKLGDIKVSRKADNSTCIVSGTATASVAFDVLFANNAGSATGNVDITVNIPAEQVTISGKSTLIAGEATTLTAVVLPNNATTKTVTWSANREGFSIDNNGYLTTDSAYTGTVVITAQSHIAEVYGTHSITVTPKLITAIDISGTTTMTVGETAQLSTSITPNDATVQTLSWQSSNDSIATVSSSGLVTSKAEGTVNITAIATDGSDVGKTHSITVSPAPTGQSGVNGSST
jgi:uncharacterized protein YjdB